MAKTEITKDPTTEKSETTSSVITPTPEDLGLPPHFEISYPSKIPGNIFGNSEVLRDFQQSGTVISRGTEADILQLPVTPNDPLRRLCLKRVARSTKRSIFNPGMVEEIDRQTEAREILERFREKGIKVAKVPVGYLALKDTTNNEQWMLMEYIPGKTLWRVTLEQIIEVSAPNQLLGWTKEDLTAMDDEGLGETLLKIFNLNKDMPALKQLEQLLSKLKKTQFLDNEKIERLERSITILNQAGFYHRDLHAKNIMLTDDDVWIIDFGYSQYDPKNNLDDPYEEYRLGENLQYSRDQGILSLVKPLTLQSAAQIDLERQKTIEKERRDADRVIRGLIERQKSRLGKILEETDSESTTGDKFIDRICNEPILNAEIEKAMRYGDIDKIIKYAKIIAILELERYESIDATTKYFKTMIEKETANPNIIINRLLTTLRELNPK